MGMKTDTGKPTEIVWNQDISATQVLPGIVPRENSANKEVFVPAGAGQLLPPVPGTDPPDLSGQFQADWFLSQSDGLTVANVRYIQGVGGVPERHAIVEFMQWRHLRLIVDRSPLPSQVLEFPLPDSACIEAYRITEKGTRTADNKVVAWAVSASFKPFPIRDPNPVAQAHGVTYLVMVTQSYTFGAPAADIEPSAHVAAVKAWPLLTVRVASSDPVAFPPPSFAADLKLVFAPRLTRADQHRPPNQFPSSDSRQGTNVVNLSCDTNTLSRGIPGSGLPPTQPMWNIVFDYAEPERGSEIDFDAVVFPRQRANTAPYELHGPGPAGIIKRFPLYCQRVGGQGEFDNVHIHPWVGFDDPSAAGADQDKSNSLIEAPLAADEVMHMHWRWGVGIPNGTDDPVLKRSFMGYSDQGNAPNTLPGAPLIPSNQSLRVKIANPAHDVNDPTVGLLDPTSTVVWYSPTVHRPQDRVYTQFCGHGFALAYRLKPLKAFPTEVTNTDLLDDPPIVFSYHDLRWNRDGKQQVPTASAATPGGLARNRLGTGSPPVDENIFNY